MAPTWWKMRSKSSTGEGGARRKVEDDIAKDKARSFDEVMATARMTKGIVVDSPRSARSGEGMFAFDFEGRERVGHPLPRPTEPAAAAAGQEQSGSGSATGSISSISSTGSSSEETPDPGVYRYSEPAVTPRSRGVAPEFKLKQHMTDERLTSIPISPRKDGLDNFSNFSLNGGAYSHQFTPINETRSRQGSVSPGPKPRGYAVPFTKSDEMRNSPHPLPLPPGSPTSPASRSLQSKWKKGKLIGSGTFGRVYAGFNSEKGQMCAIKEVDVVSDDSNSKESLKQLSQEINLLGQLSHPNIVQYYGSELIDGTLSVFLEYVSGGSIYKLLQEYGAFSEQVIQSYTKQILSGLAYLHGRNTIHRDIKGANILVGTNGEVKLADFGMAKHISSYTSIRSFKGSPYWMAPEVIMNTNGYGLPADIWSLGCTVLEMATAKPPWNSFTAVQAIFKIGNSKDVPEIPNNLSDEAKHFVKLCLQRDPSARPTAAQLLDHPFVRERTKSRHLKANILRDTLPYDGIISPTAQEYAQSRSISPLQTRQTFGHSPAINRSEPASMRMNVSLPESPCSSPLRQYRQSNWSCLPSPPHSNQMVGVATLGSGNGLLFPLGYSNRYTDHWHDMSPLNGRSPYGSPRG